jgi:hypothetical protein
MLASFLIYTTFRELEVTQEVAASIPTAIGNIENENINIIQYLQ